MRIGIVGLGKMGGNMARRLARGGIDVRAFDATPSAREALRNEAGVTLSPSLDELIPQLGAPRALWLMLPSGDITEAVFQHALRVLGAGDVLVDGGNANYKDSQRRARECAQKGVRFLDCGVSGGIWGLANGYCLMIGGEASAVSELQPALVALSADAGKAWRHCGASGAGHFTKMIHNGIEYGMMQAFAEGFSLLEGASELGIDIPEVAELWRHGSVVRSWLLDLMAAFLKDGSPLEEIAPVVADSGEGRWTALEAVERGIPAPIITLALMNRFSTQGKGDHAARLLSRMRAAFGGHAMAKNK